MGESRLSKRDVQRCRHVRGVPAHRDDELLRAALSAWADQTQELLRWIEGQGDAVSDTRSPKQVMALGSFRTHLVMGLKALRYSEG